MPTLVAAFLLFATAAEPRAFPSAEGAGAASVGGRGGQILFVTNLGDSGPGSLREAVETKGPRIVLFRVSGIIDLKSDLRIREPFITIAGQSAPGDGICLKSRSCRIDTHDVVLRHLRFRPGDAAGKELDALSIHGNRIIIDHCSASWAIDETLSVTHADNVTVQWCFITESLNRSIHKKGEHGYGSLISGEKGTISFHHNLYAHHKSRSPRPGGKEGAEGPIVDFRNNVIYNWSDKAGYSGPTAVRMNYVGNFLRQGPSDKRLRERIAFTVGGPATRLFVAENVFEGFSEGSLDNTKLIAMSNNASFPPGHSPASALVKEPFAVPTVQTVQTESAASAAERVLLEGGATLPRRDAVDRRVSLEVRQRTGRIIDSPRDVNGWPAYRSEEAAVDSDQDGMPDDWEKGHGLDASTPAASSADTDGDGWPDIEEWLEGTDPTKG